MSKKETEFKLGRKTVAIIMIVVGVVIYGLSFLLLDMIPPIQIAELLQNKLLKYLFKVILELTKLLSGVILSTGGISLLMEISTIKGLIVEVYDVFMNRVLKADFDLSHYSKETLEELQRNIIIQKSDNKISSDILAKTVYSLESNLLNLSMGLYYKDYDATFVISPDEANGMFKKTANLKYTIINNHEHANTVKHILGVLRNKVSEDYNGKDMSIEDLIKQCKFKIKKFKINSTDLTDQAKKYMSIKNDKDEYEKVYLHKLVFERSLQGCKSHKIELNMEYCLPISDISHSFKLILPCQDFKHKIHLKGPEANKWEVELDAFASFYYSGSELEKDFKIYEPTSTCSEVLFENWVLPGSGYMVLLNKTH